MLSQYWKNELLDGTITISYFGGSNNIFAKCIYESCQSDTRDINCQLVVLKSLSEEGIKAL